MRQLTRPLVRYVAETARGVARDWNAFWFTPADPTLMGLIRVLTGLMLLYTHAVWGLALNDFFGTTPWLSRSLVREMQSGEFTYSLWWLVPDGMIWPAWALSMAVFAAFTVGLWTRLTSALSLALAISYAYRVPEALFGLDQINVMLTLYLTIGDAGRALSVDRWRAVRHGGAPVFPAPSAASNLGQRLINVHMCVIYFFAGISKLQGAAWWSGEAMWGAFANLEYQSMDMTWLAWHPWLLNLASHVTILWEVFFCVLIWKPRWNPLILAGGVALHFGIGAFLGMWTFGLIMLVGCASFLPNVAVRDLVATLFARRSAAPAWAVPAPVLSLPRREETHESALAGHNANGRSE